MSNWDYPSNKVVPQHVNANLGDVPTTTSNLVSASIGSTFPRGILILSIVAISTITVAVIAVPTTLVLTYTGPFSTIASNSSSTSTIISTTVSTVPTTVVTTVVTTVSLASQCSSYTTISDSTRLSTSSGGSICDISTFSSIVTWVRFTSPGGTQISPSAVPSNQCGTQASGWFNGSMPSIGVTINGTVCYQWSSNTCNWSNKIQITNCGSFYVYGLIAPPVCNLRYCTV